jgi:hypothetical protein
VKKSLYNITAHAELERLKARIRDELLLNKLLLSVYRNSKESVPDPRPSSRALGGMAAAFLGCVFGALLLMDLVTLLRYLCALVAKRQHKSGRETLPDGNKDYKLQTVQPKITND